MSQEVFRKTENKATRCGFVVIVMAGYWVSECLPLAVTGLIPMLAFPFLGILSSYDLSMEYLNETNQLMFGGLIVALTIEYCNLHKRIAIQIVSWVGCKHLRLTFGLFFCTMFVSMWITNTATVSMIAPITLAILKELEMENLIHVYEGLDGKPIPPDDKTPVPQSQTVPSKTTICYFLGVTWSATIGGIGTLIGTDTNLTVKGIYEPIAEQATSNNGSSVYAVKEISFTSWMLFNVPHMLVSQFCVWIALNIMFLGLFVNMVIDEDVKNYKNVEKEEMNERLTITKERFKKRLQDMGKMTWHEKTVGLIFILIVFLWVFRKPGFIQGWAWNNMITDTTPVFVVVMLLFILPENIDFLKTLWNKEERPTEATKSCVTWPVVNQKMPWNVLFLLGGGFALSKGIKASKLDNVIADALSVLASWPDFVVMLVVCIVTTCFTEFTSNVAVANIVMPIVVQMAQTVNVNAIYLVVPVGVSCSFAFMLPTGTPSNALVLAMINMPPKYMFVAGIAPKIITLSAVVGCVLTVGKLVYGF